MRSEEVEGRANVRIGRTLRGRWTLEALIGVGGTSAVYAATHRNGAKVAIKVLHPSVSAIREVRERFLREGYLANRVRHPAIVTVLDDDVDEDEGVAFLVMERVDGESLAQRAAERLLGEDELLDVAAQVLDALAAAHAHGVVHRDLKPENLLVERSGRIRILDFGIARLLETNDEMLIGFAGVCGTPGFLAPEQASGARDRISPRTDLFNLGATLFAIATGRVLFEDETLQIELLRAASEQAPSLARYERGLSADFVALVDRATRFDPAERWATAEEMLREVERIRVARRPKPSIAPAEPPPTDDTIVSPAPAALSDSCSAVAVGGPSPAAPASSPMAPRRSRRRAAAPVLAGVALVALAIVLRIAPHRASTAASLAGDVGRAIAVSHAPAAPSPTLATPSSAPPVASTSIAPPVASTTSSVAASATSAASVRAKAPKWWPPRPTTAPTGRSTTFRDEDAQTRLPAGYRESPY